MRKCKCGNDVARNAKFCSKCGHRFTSGFVKFIAWSVGIFFGLPFLLVIIGQSAQTPTTASANPAVTDSIGRAVPAGVSNDADLLVARCGRPTSDESSANDDPRPPIPSRVVEYQREKLRFLFVPGNGTSLGDPPPYKWKLVGMTDMTAADPSEARVVPPAEAVGRMPCWAGK
jgi:hypothetical protein